MKPVASEANLPEVSGELGWGRGPGALRAEARQLGAVRPLDGDRSPRPGAGLAREDAAATTAAFERHTAWVLLVGSAGQRLDWVARNLLNDNPCKPVWWWFFSPPEPYIIVKKRED